MPSHHALLSPSSAHRWLNCTPAPMLEKDAPNKDTDFAREGTLAHAYCAKKLKEFFGQPTTDEDREIAQYAGYYSPEMDEYTDTYKTIVLEKLAEAQATTPDARLLVETRLDLGGYVPEAFGTADAIIIADGTMEIIDLKYGKGVKVSARHNPQMMIYALGAHELFSFEYNITEVRMTIVQPRIDNISECALPTTHLLAWADTTLRPRAELAHRGEGEQKAGEWCKFCRVKGNCRALADHALDTATACDTPALLTPDEIATKVLPRIETIKSWLAGIEAYALEQALAGTEYKGYKVVEGRSVRKIANPEAIMAGLQAQGYEVEAYMKPAELRSLTELEKLAGKKAFASLFGDHVVKPQGKPTLAPESDKRPAFNSAENDFKDY